MWKPQHAVDISDTDFQVCFDTGGTDPCKEEHGPGKSQHLNPEEQKPRRSFRQHLMETENILEDLSQVLIQKTRPTVYYLTLPICQPMTPFLQQCVFTVVSMFLNECLYRNCLELKGKENALLQIVKTPLLV